jgi:hypothetical protein
MNERIKQLAEQAAISCGYFIGPRLYMTHEEEMEKFAELMIVEFTEAVKETATRVAQTAFNDGEDAVAVQKRVAGALRVLDVMRERFGVSE